MAESPPPCSIASALCAFFFYPHSPQIFFLSMRTARNFSPSVLWLLRVYLLLKVYVRKHETESRKIGRETWWLAALSEKLDESSDSWRLAASLLA